MAPLWTHPVGCGRAATLMSGRPSPVMAQRAATEPASPAYTAFHPPQEPHVPAPRPWPPSSTSRGPAAPLPVQEVADVPFSPARGDATFVDLDDLDAGHVDNPVSRPCAEEPRAIRARCRPANGNPACRLIDHEVIDLGAKIGECGDKLLQAVAEGLLRGEAPRRRVIDEVIRVEPFEQTPIGWRTPEGNPFTADFGEFLAVHATPLGCAHDGARLTHHY